jgi:hypothetical protein
VEIETTNTEEVKKELVINGKEYKYNLNRKHVFMLSRIIGMIGIKPDLDDNFGNLATAVTVFSDILGKIYKAETESLAFIASAFGVEIEEIEKIGYQNEIKLWWNLFDNEKDFFMNLLPSKKQNNEILSTVDTIAPN